MDVIHLSMRQHDRDMILESSQVSIEKRAFIRERESKKKREKKKKKKVKEGTVGIKCDQTQASCHRYYILVPQYV